VKKTSEKAAERKEKRNETHKDIGINIGDQDKNGYEWERERERCLQLQCQQRRAMHQRTKPTNSRCIYGENLMRYGR